MKGPCQGCSRRTLTCHYQGMCKDFEEWKAYEAGRKSWLDSFKHPESESMRKNEIRRLRRQARGWQKKGGGYE